jgi:hypothetical protein
MTGFYNISAMKVKVYLTLEQATEAQRGNIYSYTLSLTSALDGGGWSKPRLGRLTSGKETCWQLYKRLCGS